jgi:capsular polysaccharide biosynthesis protein
VSPDSQVRHVAQPTPDSEPEVELSSFWDALIVRWWIPVLGLVLGAVIGYLVSLGGGKVYQAKATIYLGQPLNSNGTGQVQGLGTNATVVNQIIKSPSVVNGVAAKVGVPPGKLRQGIGSSAVSGNAQKTGQTPLVTVTVRGPWRHPTADAANMLATIVVDDVSTYADAKIVQLQARSASQQQQLDALDSAIAKYQAAGQDQQLSASERLVATGLLTSAVTQRADVADAKSDTDLQLAQAKAVERGQVVTHAAATQVAARSRRSSMIVGAVIGLLVGVAVALLWEPIRRRTRRAASGPSPRA